MNPSVSIVIPAAKYISVCLECVLRKILEIVEAIVMTRDFSRDIIQKYAAKDDRIIPAFQKNGRPEPSNKSYLACF
ncbi:hypothetical protein [Bacillus paralicheniformis]|uniref:hypothetical protein n=1 Tax=Bacillus paralicheniformis TaxID=1648923 RepID=UPI0011BD6E4E|nr:hypothetical protein [Bacillus paralicheniformis]TWK86558.1 hypothetical protein CHCC20333_1665 [Bacillus paralicheniformis]